MYQSVRGDRTYGEFKRFVREQIPAADRRKLDVSLRRDGVRRLKDRQRIVAALSVLIAGFNESQSQRLDMNQLMREMFCEKRTVSDDETQETLDRIWEGG